MREASGLPVKIVWEEPVTLLNESVPVEQLFVSLLLVPHHGGRHIVAPAGVKQVYQNKLLPLLVKNVYVKSVKTTVSRKKYILNILNDLKFWTVMLCRYATIITQGHCLQTGADGVALK